jgi:UDP-glucose 4-epimerase
LKILITGGAGYIGSHVVKQLGEQAEHDITVLDNLSTGFKSSVLYGKLVEMDLADFAAVEAFFMANSFDAVIHFAAKIVVSESVSQPAKYYLNNTANAANLFDCAAKSGVKYLVFSSTAAVYGDSDTGIVSEMSEKAPLNPYGHSKLMSEQVLKDVATASDGLKFVILRYFNVAGASVDCSIGQRTPEATHLIKVACETIVGKREKMSIFGEDYPTKDGTCIRDYIHIEDLASAHLSALEYLVDGGDSDVFNCGYGRGFSVLEVIETIKKVSGVDFQVEKAPRRDGDAAKLISENSKIKSNFKWAVKYDNLELICKSALDWEKKLLEINKGQQ